MVNGLYIPFFFVAHYLRYKDIFLATVICLKMYPVNYFFWFNNCYTYRNIPVYFNWIKQFIIFANSGHVISLLYHFYPGLLPVAFNTNFMITSCYWLGRIFFNIKVYNDLNEHVIIKEVEYIYCLLNNTLPLILFIFELLKYPNTVFNFTSLCYSYMWAIGWIVCVYSPWRILTNDYVYNIFNPSIHTNTILVFITIFSGLYIISNSIGYLLTNVVFDNWYYSPNLFC